ncbi:hypothetical protein [Nocardia otitidiscaviarum]|uniref:hypothetical protein n=1 Tax=Nocardia otitidiscaviarum TaxID=1823 RepID=UPI0004A703FF|nr:hypothetical protein [Nocardia otitidiscaviarum]
MPPKGRTPAKKAAPRKRPSTPAERTDTFHALRARASKAPGITVVAPEPLVFNEFDPPIVAKIPDSLMGKLSLEIAGRDNDYIEFLRLAIGPDGLMQAVRTFNDEKDGERLLLGLMLRIADHFYGRGAGDVPGGTPASSPK